MPCRRADGPGDLVPDERQAPLTDSPRADLAAPDIDAGWPLTLASLSPSSATVRINTKVKFDVTIHNGGSATAEQVGITLGAAPAGVGFAYKAKGGSTNTPVDIAANQSQEFEVEITPTRTFGQTQIVLGFAGSKTPPTCPFVVLLRATR